MKKVTKATIAAAAAAVLLAGGVGTLALWQKDANVDAGAVSTGHLNLTVGTDGTWTDKSADAQDTNFNPATDELVPGDTVSYTQTVTIDAEGKNLQGALTVGSAAAVPAALAGEVEIDLAIDASVPGLTKVGNVVSFAEEGTYQVPLEITVSFAKGTTGSTANGTMDQDIDLSQLALTLDQVRP